MDPPGCYANPNIDGALLQAADDGKLFFAGEAVGIANEYVNASSISYVCLPKFNQQSGCRRSGWRVVRC